MGIALIVILTAIATLFISPFALIVVDGILPGADWQRLSTIGQSYTGFAALLSAAALVAVAFSVRVQIKQTEIAHLLDTRDLQHRLIAMAFEDPLYASAIGATTDTSKDAHDDFRRNFFRTLFLRYTQFSFLAGGRAR